MVVKHIQESQSYIDKMEEEKNKMCLVYARVLEFRILKKGEEYMKAKKKKCYLTNFSWKHLTAECGFRRPEGSLLYGLSQGSFGSERMAFCNTRRVDTYLKETLLSPEMLDVDTRQHEGL